MRRKRAFGLSRPRFLSGLRMCQSAAIRHGTGLKSSVALLELGGGSCVKSCTLMSAARRVSRRSSGGCSMWLMSHAISVGGGEGRAWDSERWRQRKMNQAYW